MNSFAPLDGVARKTTATGGAAQTSYETLAAGLWVLALAFAFASSSIYSAWMEEGAVPGSFVELFGIRWMHSPGSLAELHGVIFAHSFEDVLAFEWCLPDLLSSLVHLRALVLKLVDDPTGVVMEFVRRLGDVASLIDFDAAYFLESAQALGTLNVFLTGVKMLATYGRQAFAALDAISVSGGPGMVDGAVQLHECVAPPTKAVRDARFATLLARWGLRRSRDGGSGARWEGAHGRRHGGVCRAVGHTRQGRWQTQR